MAETGCGTGKLWKDLLLSSYCMCLIHLIFLCSWLLPTCSVWQENGVGWYFYPFSSADFHSFVGPKDPVRYFDVCILWKLKVAELSPCSWQEYGHAGIVLILATGSQYAFIESLGSW